MAGRVDYYTREGELEGYDPGGGTGRGVRLVEIGVYGDRVGNDDAWERRA